MSAAKNVHNEGIKPEGRIYWLTKKIFEENPPFLALHKCCFINKPKFKKNTEKQKSYHCLAIFSQ